MAYALGEIILVVAGVLIAIGINNINEQNKAKDQSKVYLQGMLIDLSEDIRYLDKMLIDLNTQLSYEEWILNQNEYLKTQVDSIEMALSDINWKFYINDRSFQNIQNNDGIKLVGYEELYSEISQYYIVTNKRVNESNEIDKESSLKDNYFKNRLSTYLYIKPRQYSDYSGFKVEIDLGKNAKSENFVALNAQLTSVSIRNYLHDRYSRHNYNYLVLSMASIKAKQLHSRVEQSLDLLK